MPVHASAPDGNITYVMPLYLGFQSLTADTLRQNVDLLRGRIGEGTYVRVGFTVYIFVSMDDWSVDIANPAAVRNALSGTIAQIDAAIGQARAGNIPICLSILLPSRSRYDPVQTASELEDRRNMQWYSDNRLANGWWTHSRYARKQRAIQQAYVRELGRVVANRMNQYPDTLVAATGDGEVELSFDHPQLRPGSSFLADYSPFAVAEFRDWLRHGGLYAGGQPFGGQGYEQGARYAGDASPGADTNHDGHTLNGDFNTSFSTWNLRYFDWSLDDDPAADPHTIPATVYTTPDWNPLPDAGASYFDPPRTRQPGQAWWEIWTRFKQTMIWRHNVEFAAWMTTSVDPATGATVPSERWYSDQIPADYLFGHTPESPDPRLESSASPWWTADVSPYGSLGITSFNLNLGNGSFLRTMASVAPLIAARGLRWGIIEWNPSVPGTSSKIPYEADLAVLERYRPNLLIPLAWDDPHSPVLDSGFETALRRFVQRNGNGPPPLPPPDEVAIDFGSAGLWILHHTGSGSQRADSGDVYTKLHPLSPGAMATGDLDGNGKAELILDFPGVGVWVWFNGESWFQLHPSNAASIVTADLDGNGQADVMLDFPGFGLWVWYNNARWSQLHAFSPSRMVTGDLDGNLQTDLIVDLPGYGVWVWFNNAFWQQLHALNTTALATGDLDGETRTEVLVAFRGFGLWVWRNNASWVQLHPREPSLLATGDLDGNGRMDAIIDFPGFGLWVWANNSSWYQLHPSDAQRMTVGDIDGNRQADVMIDFGAPGLWAWVNNTAWVQLHTLSPEGLVSGDFDGT